MNSLSAITIIKMWSSITTEISRKKAKRNSLKRLNKLENGHLKIVETNLKTVNYEIICN